jgi:hypothetical protein
MRDTVKRNSAVEIGAETDRSARVIVESNFGKAVHLDSPSGRLDQRIIARLRIIRRCHQNWTSIYQPCL